MKLRDWWLDHAPYPFWASCCGVWSPWCWLDDVLHLWFPMTFGFYSEHVSHEPLHQPWCCRKHDQAIDRYAARRWPDD